MTITNLKLISRDPNRAFPIHPTPIKKNKIAAFGVWKACPPNLAEAAMNNYRRSDASKDRLIADFLKSDITKPPCIKDEHFEIGLQQAVKRLAPPFKYRPVHYLDSKLYPFTVNSSVEAPFNMDPKGLKLASDYIAKQYQAGLIPNQRRTFSNLFEFVYDYFRPIVHQIKLEGPRGNKFRYFNTAHARSHLVEASEPDKIRMVHGVPKLQIIVEVMFLWPYLNWLRKQNSALLWGYETMMGGIGRIYHDVSKDNIHYNCFIGIDWKSFDKMVSFELIDCVHKQWYQFLDLSHGYIPTTEKPNSRTDKWRLDNLWSWMTQAVKRTQILLPDGSLWERRFASIASGLLQTQLLDSWVNAIVLLTCLSELGFDLDRTYLKVMGDDSIIACDLPGRFSYHEVLPAIAEVALRRFGFILSVEKSQCQPTLEGMKILGYSCQAGLPYREPERLLAQLLYPEKYPTVAQMASRAIGIAHASCARDVDVFSSCKDVFDYCIQKSGGVVDVSGSHLPGFITQACSLDLGTFPTRESIYARLFRTRSHTDLEDQEAYWPSDHFLAEY